MKKLLLLTPLLFGCASIKFVHTEHGQIVTDKQQRVSIIGNPELTCYDVKGNVIANGYFVRQADDGSFVLDEFGTRYVVVPNPFCKLGNNE
jgi:hypothetical protein